MRSPSWLALALCTTPLTGCSLVSDLDRFEQAPDQSLDGAVADQDAGTGTDASATDGGGATIGCGNPTTLCLELSGFDEYKGERVVIDLVTQSTGVLRARAVLDPIGDQTTQEIVMPLAIPDNEIPDGEEHPLKLEIWVDKDDDRAYSADTDEAFRVGLNPNGVVQYTRDEVDMVELTAPEEFGGDFVMEVSGFQIHPKRMFEVMVIDDESGRTLGLARIDAIPSDGIFTVQIPGIIDTDEKTYTLEFYADANNNRTYDGVGPDHSWIVEAESGTDGLQLDRTHSAPSSGPGKDDPSFKFTALKYQFPFEP
jgi:hypothetical protein